MPPVLQRRHVPVAGMPLWEPIHDLKLEALEEIIDEAQASRYCARMPIAAMPSGSWSDSSTFAR